MSKIRNGSFASPTPDTYVKSAIATLGLEGDSTGYVSHWLIGSSSHDLLPSSLIMKITSSMAKAIRAKALKRIAAKKE